MGHEADHQVFMLEPLAIRVDVCPREDVGGVTIPPTYKGPSQLDTKVLAGRATELSCLEPFEFRGRWETEGGFLVVPFHQCHHKLTDRPLSTRGYV